MSKRREQTVVATTKFAKTRKKKAEDTPSVSTTQQEVQDMPTQTADFQAFLKSVETENFDVQFPTYAHYTDFRFELPTPRGFVAELDAAPQEYAAGWNGIGDILAMLWTKYLGDKFQSQELANFVFTLLLSGVEQGWTAIVNYVKSKLGEEAATDTGAVVDGLNQLFTQGGYAQIVDEIKKSRQELNTPVAATGQKPNFWQKVLRGLRIAFSFLASKK